MGARCAVATYLNELIIHLIASYIIIVMYESSDVDAPEKNFHALVPNSDLACIFGNNLVN